jgi:hypothetical protein
VVFIKKGSHHSENSKQKISKNNARCNKGKKLSPDQAEKLHAGRRGKPPWNKGKTGIYSAETLKAMSDGHKDKPTWNKGKKMDKAWHEKSGRSFRGHKHSPETIAKMSEDRSGENHWHWKGGITPELTTIRTSDEYDEWRTDVFRRDEFTCQKCYQVGGELRAHHQYNFAKYPTLRLEVSNGVTLCKECHDTFHSLFGRVYNNPNQLIKFCVLPEYANIKEKEYACRFKTILYLD